MGSEEDPKWRGQEMSEVIDERIRYLEWRVESYINVLERNMRSSKNQETKVRYKSQIRLLRSTLEDIAFVNSKDPAELKRLRESWEEHHKRRSE